MSKRDVLDKETAQRFAWRTTEPEAPPAPKEVPASAAPPPDPQAQRERAEHAARRCADLAGEVAQVWTMTSPPHQAEATRGLVRFAKRLAFDIVRMEEHPLEAVRLWRLIVRHRTRVPLGPGETFALGFMPVSSRQREVVDLLVEAAETGDSKLAFVLDRQAATEETGRRHPELGARLAHVVDTGKTWKARVLAAQWLSIGEFPDAVPALRRALRTPHARLRTCAIFILSEMKDPALLAEDVALLLEDAVHHPLPRGWGIGGFERARDYEEALLAAVRKAPPPEGWRPLEIIANGGGAHIQREREGLGPGWALRALAAGYPERAVGRIDRELASMGGWRHRDAVEAIGVLPDELARPRLLSAAAQEEHRVAERAKEIWFERFGGQCPVEPVAGVAVELLADAPSERFFACLTVLRGASDEARNAMVDALLAEAPERETPPESLAAAQREALALVLFTLQHRGRLHQHPTLTFSEGEWTLLLLRRFGDLAFAGLAAMAERAAVAGAPYGWLSALVSTAREGKLREPQMDRLREIARAALASPAWENSTAPLDALAVVGAPADLEERLWTIATRTPELHDDLGQEALDAARAAIRALLTMRDAPGQEACAAQAAERARAARDWDLFERLVHFGGERGAAAVLDVAERALADFDGDPRALGPLCRAAWTLEKAGRIHDAWILDQLRRPNSPVFAIATHLVGTAASEPLRAALRDALDSSARGGAAAAEAATRLLALEELAVDDRRLDDILDRASEHARADLVTMLIDREAPLSACRRHVVELLLAPGDDTARDLVDALYSKEPEGMYELFEELLPRVTAKNVRATMEHYLRVPNEAELYWADRDDDGEEQDGEDEKIGDDQEQADH